MPPRSSLAVALVAALTVASPASGQGVAPPEPLQRLQRAIDEARERERRTIEDHAEFARETAAVRAEAIAAAEAAQTIEAVLAEVERRVAGIEAGLAERRSDLQRRESARDAAVLALASLAQARRHDAAAQEADALAHARAGIVLASIAARTRAEAAAIAADVGALEAMATSAVGARDQVRSRTQALARERARLESILARREQLAALLGSAPAEVVAQAAALGRDAPDMPDLVSRLGAVSAPAAALDAAPGAAARRVAESRGQLAAPVAGTVVAAFGQPNPFGLPGRGLTFAARPGGVVVAPFDGRVVFAGPFRSYGRTLILDLGEGYHVVMTGLGRIDGAAGRWVARGEPVGTTELPANGSPNLYLELRRNGQSIDPAPWLAPPKEKTSG